MNIIVTGGAGFIGGNFCHYISEKYPDDTILCIDKLTYAGNMETLAPIMDSQNFKFFKTDIADREAVYKIFETEKPDIVVNFAAESHVDRSINEPEVFLKTNIIGTSVLLDACRQYGIKRYHQVSTDEVYGDLPLTCLYRHIHAHMGFLVQYPDVQITMGHTIFQRSLSHLLFQMSLMTSLYLYMALVKMCVTGFM